MRHTCEISDAMKGVDWNRHDGRFFGQQTIVDEANGITLNTTFVNRPSEDQRGADGSGGGNGNFLYVGGGDWTLKVQVASNKMTRKQLSRAMIDFRMQTRQTPSLSYFTLPMMVTMAILTLRMEVTRFDSILIPCTIHASGYFLLFSLMVFCCFSPCTRLSDCFSSQAHPLGEVLRGVIPELANPFSLSILDSKGGDTVSMNASNHALHYYSIAAPAKQTWKARGLHNSAQFIKLFCRPPARLLSHNQSRIPTKQCRHHHSTSATSRVL